MKACPCGSVRYCSITCQQTDWKTHRQTCDKGRSNTLLITEDMCKAAVVFVHELHQQKPFAEDMPLIVLIPPQDTPDSALRLTTVDELRRWNPRMREEMVDLLTETHNDNKQRAVHILWFTNNNLIHKRLCLRNFCCHSFASPEDMVIAWITQEQRGERSVGCYQQNGAFHFLVDSIVLERYLHQKAETVTPYVLVRGVCLPGLSPDEFDDFTLLGMRATDSLEEKTCDVLSEYFGLSIPHVVLLRRDICWTCKTRSTKLCVCTGCRVGRYCGATCQFQDWLYHKQTCAALQPLERVKLTPTANE
jgi:hypothetical protein